jgi:hypothetical protein
MLRLLAALAVLLTARTARADDGYRGEMAIVDGASVAVFGGGLLLRHGAEHGGWRRRIGTAVAITGVLGATVGAGLVHAHHDQDQRAAGSIAIRLAVPGAVTAGFLAYYVGCIFREVKHSKVGGRDDGCLSERVALATIGLTYAAAVVVDYALASPPSSLSARIRPYPIGYARSW